MGGAAKNGKKGRRPAADVPLTEIVSVRIDRIRYFGENDWLYGAIPPDDRSMADLLARDGQLDPVVLTRDGFLLSGHRRTDGARKLGWTRIDARFDDVTSDDRARCQELLVLYNRSRNKTPDMLIREELVLTDPEHAYRNLVAERAKVSRVNVAALALGARRGRSRITAAKKPFLDAILRILGDLKPYWPVSDRRVHYSLLNNPPLVHAGKPGSRYRNNRQCYKATCELLTRARIAGDVPFEAIGDETRPVTTWDVHPDVGPFVRRSLDTLFDGYWRDLTQSQPNHVEILGEKLTVEGVVRPVAARYCLPYTIGRGYASLPPRHAMYQRFRASGKAKLIVLVLSDHDPEGWDIGESFGKSMRDDFGVEHVVAVKVGLTADQAADLRLPQNADVKTGSSRFRAFERRFGRSVWELEAVPPATLEGWLDAAVRRVLRTDRFNEQVELEKRDAARLEALRRTAVEYLKDISME